MIFTNLPMWLSGLLIVVLPTLLAMSGPLVIRRFFSFDRIRVNNEVAGFKFATVGVLYAVLLAFAVIIVWEKFAEADRVAAKEASAIATLYRLSKGFDTDAGDLLRSRLTAYARSVVSEDWPAMSKDGHSERTKGALDEAYAAVLALAPANNRGVVMLTETLQQLDQVTQARRDRLVLATGAVPGMLWSVLVLGAVLTIGFTFFFGTQNVIMQSLMTGILASLIFSGLLVIVGIDRPFSGPVSVRAEAMTIVLEDFTGARSS